MAWNLEWNNLRDEEKQAIKRAAEMWACPTCGDPGQMALDMFYAVVGVIKERDQREVVATLTPSKVQDDSGYRDTHGSR